MCEDDANAVCGPRSFYLTSEADTNMKSHKVLANNHAHGVGHGVGHDLTRPRVPVLRWRPLVSRGPLPPCRWSCHCHRGRRGRRRHRQGPPDAPWSGPRHPGPSSCCRSCHRSCTEETTHIQYTQYFHEWSVKTYSIYSISLLHRRWYLKQLHKECTCNGGHKTEGCGTFVSSKQYIFYILILLHTCTFLYLFGEQQSGGMINWGKTFLKKGSYMINNVFN